MGFLLLLPFFLVRFGLLSLLSRDAVGRAAHFAPLAGNEKIAYWIYQISNLAILVCVLFFQIKRTSNWLFFTGLAISLAGLILLTLSVIGFSAPAENGINQNGIYRISRNPMYVAYFVCFIGWVVLTQSLVLLALVLLFQITAHWIIRSEERWCVETFGEAYLQYMKRVRRYL